MSRRPIVVNTDVCSSRIIVRTCATPAIDGVLRRQVDTDRDKRGWRKGRGEKKGSYGTLEVRVEVEMPHGVGDAERIYKESILPIEHVIRNDPRDPIPDPYEVHTIYTDSFTKKIGAWQLRLIVEHMRNKNGELWLCTVEDVDNKVGLVTVTAKELDTSATMLVFPPEALPLQRLQTPEPLSAWQRLRRLTAEPQLPDEESWS